MTVPIYPLAVRGLTWPVMKTGEFSTIVQSAPNFIDTRIAQSQNPVWHWTLTYEYLKDNPLDLVAALSPHTDYRYLQGFLLSLQGKFAEFFFQDLNDDCVGMRSQVGGGNTTPSVFRAQNYPGVNLFYPLGSYIVDNNATPHLQKVTTGGVPGTTVPVFNTGGGTTASGSAVFTDQGVFSGANAGPLALVTDGTFYYSPIQRSFGGQFLEDVTDLNTLVYPLTIWANGVKQATPANYSLLGPGLSIPGNSYEGLYVKWVGTPTGPITALCQYYFRVHMESDEQDIEQFMQQLWTIGGEKSKNGSGMLKFETSRGPSI